MHPSLIILAVASSFITGVCFGVIASVWYAEKVKDPVSREQKGGSCQDEDVIKFDCEAI